MKTKSRLHIDKKTTIPYIIHKKEPEMTIDHSKTDAAYSPCYNQAFFILQAIQLNGRRRLSPHCVTQLADYVIKSWEMNNEPETSSAISNLMNSLLDTTLLCPEKNLNEALVEFCKNETASQSVSPSVTLLLAIDYIGRLKQRYTNVKGTKGCGQRLVLIAYMMASKYIHINLKSIVNTDSFPTQRNSVVLPPLKNHVLPSPPTSPKSFDSNPLNYHYFGSLKKTPEACNQSTPISRMEVEFLHFLNFDLSLHDTVKLTRWSQNFDDDLDKLEETNSGYEGDTD